MLLMLVNSTLAMQSNATPDANDDDCICLDCRAKRLVQLLQARLKLPAGATASSCTVRLETSWLAYDVKCVISSSTATDSPKSDSKAVTCSVVNTLGTATVSGSTTPTVR